MKRTALALLAVSLLRATAVEPPLPTLRAEPVEEGSAIWVRNTAPAPLTAFVIEIVDYPGTNFGVVRDEIWGKPIAAGEERELRVSSLMPGTVPKYLKVRAAIYADGTTAGEAEKIVMLLDERRKRLRAIRAVLARIAGMPAGAGETAIMEDLQRWRSSLEPELRPAANEVISQLRSIPATRVLDHLKERERLLAESKPALR